MRRYRARDVLAAAAGLTPTWGFQWPSEAGGRIGWPHNPPEPVQPGVGRLGNRVGNALCVLSFVAVFAYVITDSVWPLIVAVWCLVGTWCVAARAAIAAGMWRRRYEDLLAWAVFLRALVQTRRGPR